MPTSCNGRTFDGQENSRAQFPEYAPTGMPAEGESDQRALGSLSIISQGEGFGDSNEGLARRLVHEQGGVVETEDEQVEIVVVDILVTVRVDTGATLGQVNVVGFGGQLEGESDTVTVAHDVRVGVVEVDILVTMQAQALESRDVEARQGLANAGILVVTVG